MYNTAHKCGKINGTKGRIEPVKSAMDPWLLMLKKPMYLKWTLTVNIEHWTIIWQQSNCCKTRRNLNPWSKPRWTINRWTSEYEYLNARWTVFGSSESEQSDLKQNWKMWSQNFANYPRRRGDPVNWNGQCI